MSFFKNSCNFFVHPICIFLFHYFLCNYSFIIANPFPVNHEFTDKKQPFPLLFLLAPFSVLTTMKVYEDTAQKQDRIWYGYQPQQFFTDVSARWMCHHFKLRTYLVEKESTGKSGTHGPRPGTNRGAETGYKFLPIRDISAVHFCKLWQTAHPLSVKSSGKCESDRQKHWRNDRGHQCWSCIGRMPYFRRPESRLIVYGRNFSSQTGIKKASWVFSQDAFSFFIPVWFKYIIAGSVYSLYRCSNSFRFLQHFST